jgi:hypothetical protein
MLVSGEHSHEIASNISGEPGELNNVLDLNLAMRYLPVLEIGREVCISCDGDGGESAGRNSIAQAGAFIWSVIEDAQMGPLGHQQDASVSKFGGLVHELIDR